MVTLGRIVALIGIPLLLTNASNVDRNRVLRSLSSGVIPKDGTEETRTDDVDHTCAYATQDFRPGSPTGGLTPIYKMGVGFIDVVVQYTIGELITDYHIEKFEDFADEDWTDWGKEYIGLAVCAVVGVLFFIFLPLVGLCYCCCRCCCGSCCRCCRTPNVGKTSGCKRVTCGFLLLIFTTMMLLSGLAVLLTQRQVSEEVYGENGVFSDVSRSVDDVAGYVNTSLAEVEQVAIHDLSDTARSAMRMLEDVPGVVIDSLNNASGAVDLLESLQSYVHNLEPLQTNLSTMVNSTALLSDLQTELDSALGTARTYINESLQFCIQNEQDAVKYECHSLLDQLDELKSGTNFDVLESTDANVAQHVISLALDSGVVEIADKAVEALTNVSDAINREMNASITEANEELDKLLDDLNEKWEEVMDKVQDVNLSKIQEHISEAQDMVIDYSELYYTWFYIGLVVVLGAIAFFNYLGLFFGAVCKKRTERHNSACCTTRLSACCLLTSVALIFLLGGILMLITLVFFLVGGSTQFLLCRHLVCYDESMQKIENVTFNSLGVQYNISVRSALDKCSNNSAFYDALNLEENGFNITDILDLSKTGIYDMVDELKKVDIDIGTVVLVPDGLNDTLAPVSEALAGVNYTVYTEQLGKETVETNITDFEISLRQIAAVVNGSLSTNLTNAADQLGGISNTTIAEMEKERNTLTKAVANAENITASLPDASTLVLALHDAENVINTQATNLTRDVIATTADDGLYSIESFVRYVQVQVEAELAGCRPLYDSLDTVTQAFCVFFLYPFNSLWFCLGWYLFCCVFTLILGTKMAGYYRQVQPDDVKVTVHPHEPYADYDDYDDAYDRPPSRSGKHQQQDHIKPGIKTTSKKSQQREPPPDYEAAMQMHIMEAKRRDKERKKQAKQIQKELKNKSKAYDNTQV